MEDLYLCIPCLVELGIGQSSLYFGFAHIIFWVQNLAIKVVNIHYIVVNHEYFTHS